MTNFNENIVGQVLHAIITYHLDVKINYQLSEEAEDMFEVIIDNYNSQFNLKYSTSSQLSNSQPELDTSEREDIFVRTKAAELVGRVACVLSIYCNGMHYLKTINFIIFHFICLKKTWVFKNISISAFECIATGKPLLIPKSISGEYVRFAEEIVSISYTQSEKFSSVSIMSIKKYTAEVYGTY